MQLLSPHPRPDVAAGHCVNRARKWPLCRWRLPDNLIFAVGVWLFIYLFFSPLLWMWTFLIRLGQNFQLYLLILRDGSCYYFLITLSFVCFAEWGTFMVWQRQCFFLFLLDVLIRNEVGQNTTRDTSCSYWMFTLFSQLGWLLTSSDKPTKKVVNGGSSFVLAGLCSLPVSSGEGEHRIPKGTKVKERLILQFLLQENLQLLQN